MGAQPASEVSNRKQSEGGEKRTCHLDPEDGRVHERVAHMRDEVKQNGVEKRLAHSLHQGHADPVLQLVVGPPTPEIHHAPMVDELEQGFVDLDVVKVKVGVKEEAGAKQEREEEQHEKGRTHAWSHAPDQGDDRDAGERYGRAREHEVQDGKRLGPAKNEKCRNCQCARGKPEPRRGSRQNACQKGREDQDRAPLEQRRLR